MIFTKNPPFLGRILSKPYILLACILSGLAIAFLILFQVAHIRRYNVEILSPVGVGKVKASTDPYYENILHTKTVDHFPANEYFPSHLTPHLTFKDNLAVDSFAVMDIDNRELLYGKNIATRLPIASLTKVMTSLVALENAPLDLVTAVSIAAEKVGEATMGVSAGEKVSIEELLYGAMLPSGNDAAETLAEAVGKHALSIDQNVIDGGVARRKFMDLMNEKAQSLGMLDTYFFNPTGLDEDTEEKSSFSSSLDLLALTNYALKNPTFAKIANTRFIEFPYKDRYHKAYYLENILTLSQTFEGIKGVKPGSSIFAKETLISYIERDGRRLITVILGSNHTRDDILTIYKEIFHDKKAKAF